VNPKIIIFYEKDGFILDSVKNTVTDLYTVFYRADFDADPTIPTAIGDSESKRYLDRQNVVNYALVLAAQHLMFHTDILHINQEEYARILLTNLKRIKQV